MSADKNTNEGFRRKMLNYEKAPPETVWKEIQKGLAIGRKKRLVPVFWRYAAGIVILLGIGGTWLFLSRDFSPSGNKVITDVPGQEIPLTEEKAEWPGIEDSNPGMGPEQTLAGSDDGVDRSIETRAMGTGQTGKVRASELNASPGKISVYPESSGTQNNQILASISELPLQIEPGAGDPERLKPAYKEVQYTWDDLRPDEPDLLTEPAKRSFTLSAVASPVYSYRDLGSISSSLNESFNNAESGKVNFTGGLNFGFKASKRLSIHSGIMYNRIGIGINDILALAEYRQASTDQLFYNRNSFSAYLVNNSIGSIQSGPSRGGWAKFDNSSANEAAQADAISSDLNYLNPEGFYDPADNYINDEGRIDQFFEYLEVPLTFKYMLIDKKIDLNLLSGLSTNFLVRNRVIYSSEESTELAGSTANIRSVNYTGNLGLGLDYNISQHFHFLFEPQFKYYLNSINSQNLIKNRPYTFGLYSGLIYLF